MIVLLFVLLLSYCLVTQTSAKNKRGMGKVNHVVDRERLMSCSNCQKLDKFGFKSWFI